MLDLNVKIKNLLQDLAPVELAGSEKELELPTIYIDMVSNMTDVGFDNRDFLTQFVYQIDVYAETPQKCCEMAKAVDDIMQDNGWQRTNGALMGRQRYMLTYQALVSEKFNTYKE
jgi:hypothetical protein